MGASFSGVVSALPGASVGRLSYFASRFTALMMRAKVTTMPWHVEIGGEKDSSIWLEAADLTCTRRKRRKSTTRRFLEKSGGLRSDSEIARLGPDLQRHTGPFENTREIDWRAQWKPVRGHICWSIVCWWQFQCPRQQHVW